MGTSLLSLPYPGDIDGDDLLARAREMHADRWMRARVIEYHERGAALERSAAPVPAAGRYPDAVPDGWAPEITR